MSIGIIGCGAIVRNSHLPAYEKFGLPVAGVYDPSPEAVAEARARFGVRAYASLDELLSDPAVEIVDAATHAAVRPPLVLRALESGKPVLSQKPLAPTAAEARTLIEAADRAGVILAVNQNGRFCPTWRIASERIAAGEIGDVTSIVHLFEAAFDFVPDSPFDTIPRWLLYDYMVHWVDITRCWAGDRTPLEVRAADWRPPHQDRGRQPWSGSIEIVYEGGLRALIRCVGGAQTARRGHLFWVHGSEGTIRGTVLAMHGDALEIERLGAEPERPELVGNWFNDGFARAMIAAQEAVRTGTEPWHSARHNELSLRLTLAACESADRGGDPVPVAPPMPAGGRA